MSRVNRFIFNSDFMTLARKGHDTVIVTIPAKELGPSMFISVGTVQVAAKVPRGSIIRAKAKYTGTTSTNTIATDGNVQIKENKGSGKTIDYDLGMVIGNGYILFTYVIEATGYSSGTTVLSTAQTITLDIDYLYQPNT